MMERRQGYSHIKPTTVQQFVFIGAAIFTVLILRLASFIDGGEKNRAYLYLAESAPISPYMCLIHVKLCEPNGSKARAPTWQIGTRVENAAETPVELALINHHDGNVSERIPLPAERRDFYLFVRGGLALQQGHRDAAIAIWKRQPNTAEYLGEIADRADDPEQAVELYRLSLQVKPTVPVLSQLAEVLLELDRDEDALEVLQQAALVLESSPDNIRIGYRSRVLINLGHAYRRLDKLALAQQSYQEVLLFEEDSVGALLGLAEVSLDEQDFEAARERLEYIVSLEPRSPAPLYRLATLHYDLQNFEEARNAAQNLTTVYPDYAPGWLLLGTICLKQQDYKASLAAHEKYLSLVGHEPNVEKRVTELRKLINED